MPDLYRWCKPPRKHHLKNTSASPIQKISTLLSTAANVSRRAYTPAGEREDPLMRLRGNADGIRHTRRHNTLFTRHPQIQAVADTNNTHRTLFHTSLHQPMSTSNAARRVLVRHGWDGNKRQGVISSPLPGGTCLAWMGWEIETKGLYPLPPHHLYRVVVLRQSRGCESRGVHKI